MTFSRPLSLLIAQVQITGESLSSLLVTGPTSDVRVKDVGEDIAEALQARGIDVRLLAPAKQAEKTVIEGGSGRARLERVSLLNVADMAAARELMTTSDSLTIAAVGGILDDPSALFLAAVSDGVVLVAERGKTSRTHIQSARAELQAVGAVIVGAVLLQ